MRALFFKGVGASPEWANFFLSEVFIMFQDKNLECRDCHSSFVFTVGEQEFYSEKGFTNEPQRCKICRDSRKNSMRGERELHSTQCASCGANAKVPFKPSNDRPVYCSDCFARMKDN